ncbi:hypothetical protein K432DRAFT_428398 [Lepidopterella palustris CBS 459.81]|uniref:Uncharacterized protein n=1 Tax=Lepidopterella palustris CBS 459.81 TaxID=1314670 RepID=A0A8E2JC30_9PEZI|nr:hypothetical protein K432DRAFT_428398 [Lepidopterella palustris CBS 459.81]
MVSTFAAIFSALRPHNPWMWLLWLFGRRGRKVQPVIKTIRQKPSICDANGWPFYSFPEERNSLLRTIEPPPPIVRSSTALPKPSCLSVASFPGILPYQDLIMVVSLIFIVLSLFYTVCVHYYAEEQYEGEKLPVEVENKPSIIEIACPDWAKDDFVFKPDLDQSTRELNDKVSDVKAQLKTDNEAFSTLQDIVEILDSHVRDLQATTKGTDDGMNSLEAEVKNLHEESEFKANTSNVEKMYDAIENVESSLRKREEIQATTTDDMNRTIVAGASTDLVNSLNGRVRKLEKGSNAKVTMETLDKVSQTITRLDTSLCEGEKPRVVTKSRVIGLLEPFVEQKDPDPMQTKLFDRIEKVTTTFSNLHILSEEDVPHVLNDRIDVFRTEQEECQFPFAQEQHEAIIKGIDHAVEEKVQDTNERFEETEKSHSVRVDELLGKVEQKLAQADENQSQPFSPSQTKMVECIVKQSLDEETAELEHRITSRYETSLRTQINNLVKEQVAARLEEMVVLVEKRVTEHWEEYQKHEGVYKKQFEKVGKLEGQLKLLEEASQQQESRHQRDIEILRRIQTEFLHTMGSIVESEKTPESAHLLHLFKALEDDLPQALLLLAKAMIAEYSGRCNVLTREVQKRVDFQHLSHFENRLVQVEQWKANAAPHHRPDKSFRPVSATPPTMIAASRGHNVFNTSITPSFNSGLLQGTGYRISRPPKSSQTLPTPNPNPPILSSNYGPIQVAGVYRPQNLTQISPAPQAISATTPRITHPAQTVAQEPQASTPKRKPRVPSGSGQHQWGAPQGRAPADAPTGPKAARNSQPQADVLTFIPGFAPSSSEASGSGIQSPANTAVTPRNVVKSDVLHAKFTAAEMENARKQVETETMAGETGSENVDTSLVNGNGSEADTSANPPSVEKLAAKAHGFESTYNSESPATAIPVMAEDPSAVVHEPEPDTASESQVNAPPNFDEEKNVKPTNASMPIARITQDKDGAGAKEEESQGENDGGEGEEKAEERDSDDERQGSDLKDDDEADGGDNQTPPSGSAMSGGSGTSSSSGTNSGENGDPPSREDLLHDQDSSLGQSSEQPPTSDGMRNDAKNLTGQLSNENPAIENTAQGDEASEVEDAPQSKDSTPLPKDQGTPNGVATVQNMRETADKSDAEANPSSQPEYDLDDTLARLHAEKNWLWSPEDQNKAGRESGGMAASRYATQPDIPVLVEAATLKATLQNNSQKAAGSGGIAARKSASAIPKAKTPTTSTKPMAAETAPKPVESVGIAASKYALNTNTATKQPNNVRSPLASCSSTLDVQNSKVSNLPKPMSLNRIAAPKLVTSSEMAASKYAPSTIRKQPGNVQNPFYSQDPTPHTPPKPVASKILHSVAQVTSKPTTPNAVGPENNNIRIVGSY